MYCSAYFVVRVKVCSLEVVSAASRLPRNAIVMSEGVSTLVVVVVDGVAAWALAVGAHHTLRARSQDLATVQRLTP